MRRGIQDGLEKAASDSSVTSIVFTGKSKTFPSGADISEFATGKQRLGKIIICTFLSH